MSATVAAGPRILGLGAAVSLAVFIAPAGESIPAPRTERGQSAAGITIPATHLLARDADRRGWFISGAVLLIAGLAGTLHRVRSGRREAIERLRARIAADLHDDIGGTLSRIAIQSEVARRQLPESSAVSARLAEIADTARFAVESLADVVWSVDPVQDDLASVERRVREYAADLLGSQGVRWKFHGAGHLDRFTFDPEARRDLLLLLKEGITNIARHADASVAALYLGIDDGCLYGELRDDGRGFAPPGISGGGPSGHGLANMRERAAKLRGHLAIDSAPGRGTRLRLVVPLRTTRDWPMRTFRQWSGPVRTNTACTCADTRQAAALSSDTVVQASTD
jgi:signal transduction histidine kinase